MPSHTIPHIIVRPSGPDVPTERAKRVECLTSPLPSHCDAGRTAEEYGESRCPHAAARASAAHSSPSAVAHGLEGIGTAGTMGVICWQSRSTMARICAVVLSAHTPEPSAPAAVDTVPVAALSVPLSALSVPVKALDGVRQRRGGTSQRSGCGRTSPVGEERMSRKRVLWPAPATPSCAARICAALMQCSSPRHAGEMVAGCGAVGSGGRGRGTA